MRWEEKEACRSRQTGNERFSSTREWSSEWQLAHVYGSDVGWSFLFSASDMNRHPSNQRVPPPACSVSQAPLAHYPSGSYSGVRAKWHWLLQQTRYPLKRLLSPFFPSAWPSASASFYPLSHTALPVNPRTQTRSPFIRLSHIHTLWMTSVP